MTDMQHQTVSDTERRQILHNILTMEVSQGNRVAWVGPLEAHIWRMPVPVNNVLHGVLSLLTFGLWLVIWLLVVVLQPKPVLVGVGVNELGQPYMFTPHPIDPAHG